MLSQTQQDFIVLMNYLDFHRYLSNRRVYVCSCCHTRFHSDCFIERGSLDLLDCLFSGMTQLFSVLPQGSLLGGGISSFLDSINPMAPWLAEEALIQANLIWSVLAAFFRWVPLPVSHTPGRMSNADVFSKTTGLLLAEGKPPTRVLDR